MSTKVTAYSVSIYSQFEGDLVLDIWDVILEQFSVIVDFSRLSLSNNDMSHKKLTDHAVNDVWFCNCEVL